MRIANQTVTVRSVLFGKVSAFLYFLLAVFFIYKCLMLLPIWLTARYKADEARQDYEKKMDIMQDRKEDLENRESDLGKKRYEKDFFNKLDDGENLIVLYQDEKGEKQDPQLEEPRKMFWWQEWEQDFLVWWRNLKLKK